MSSSHKKLHVLFVCTQNKVRSLTAEHLYQQRQDLAVRSCGTAPFAKNQLTDEIMNWAEMVFIFDDSQQEVLEQKFGKDVLGKEVVKLGVEDVYQYKSENLVNKLIAKIEPFLGRPNAKSAVIKRRKAASTQTAGRRVNSGSLMSKILSAVGVKKAHPAKAE
jgi:predicted protein tyrosine phosphatase